jgi:hypothetical protein
MEQYQLLNLVPTEEKHQLLREILFGTQQKGKDREMEWNNAFCPGRSYSRHVKQTMMG